ncbi:MAG: hypothetical protein AAB757_02045 [Patescibacteria group bacterium]
MVTCNKCGYEGLDSKKYVSGISHAEYSQQYLDKICPNALAELAQETVRGKEEPLIQNAGHYGEFFQQVLSEPLWSERHNEEKPKDVPDSKIQFFDSLAPLSQDEPDKSIIIAIYEEIINVVVEDAKNLSFIVAGTMEGRAAGLLKEKEKKWINLFLNARPGQLSEDGLVASPQAVGELEIVFEKARDLLADKRYSGARSIISDYLKVIRQWKEFANAPSQVSRR